jgi:perosamine synthetase
VPNNVYVAAWNPFVIEDYMLWPQDANLETWNMDLGKRLHHKKEIDFTNHRTNIILAVHNLGNILNVPNWKKEWPESVIIEDNCEGFGGMYGEPLQHSGTASEAFSMSFYGNKNLTTGEGGAFVTYDEDVYHYAHAFHGQGQSNRRFIHHIPGYNYRMNNIQAAILCGQLEIKNDIFEMKAAVFDYYMGKFKNIDGIEFQYSLPDTQHANWMFGIRVVGNSTYQQIEKFMLDAGIETRPMFYPMSYQKHLHRSQNNRVARGKEDIAKQLSREVVILPSFPDITTVQQDFIIEKVGEYVQKRLLF